MIFSLYRGVGSLFSRSRMQQAFPLGMGFRIAGTVKSSPLALVALTVDSIVKCLFSNVGYS